MSPEEFVYWLSGYLGEVRGEDLDPIVTQLRQVEILTKPFEDLQK